MSASKEKLALAGLVAIEKYGASAFTSGYFETELGKGQGEALFSSVTGKTLKDEMTRGQDLIAAADKKVSAGATPSERAAALRTELEGDSRYKKRPGEVDTLVKAYSDSTDAAQKKLTDISFQSLVTKRDANTPLGNSPETGSGNAAADLQTTTLQLVRNALEGICTRLKV